MIQIVDVGLGRLLFQLSHLGIGRGPVALHKISCLPGHLFHGLPGGLGGVHADVVPPLVVAKIGRRPRSASRKAGNGAAVGRGGFYFLLKTQAVAQPAGGRVCFLP